jgi:hypothetical protein
MNNVKEAFADNPVHLRIEVVDYAGWDKPLSPGEYPFRA